MNALINVKTAEKGLQFGSSKCKSMLIGKNVEHVLNSNLTVDTWKVTHDEVTEKIVETYEGQISVDKTDEQKYLGFVLSNKGNNMANINCLKKKSKGIIRRIFGKLESLTLKQYYFECAMIFMNSMLRSSILYACETYYNLKETEIRQIERIEEGFMRELLKTGRGCPIVQLYQELGQIPARFEIYKIRLLYLKYILNQEPESMLFKFFEAQLKTSSKGDWVYMCNEDLKTLNIIETYEEIKNMTHYSFKKILNEKIQSAAYEYLLTKQGSKGSEVKHTELKMSLYLSPISRELSTNDKCKVFEMRNKMTRIPANFSSRITKNVCFCGNNESMEHVYTCKMLNCDIPSTEYEYIYSDNLKKIYEVYTRFDENMNKRENIIECMENQKHEEKTNDHHVIQLSDPLYAV